MPAAEQTTVMIVAEHELAIEAIRRELRDASVCSVVGCVDGRRSCAASVATAEPSVVVIVDSGTPSVALARIGEAAGASAGARVVLLTDRMESDWLTKASAAGLDAALARALEPGSLATFLHEVARGNAFHTFHSLPRRESQREARPIARDLVRLSTIYRDPGVAHRTEATHRAHVNRFLGARPAARQTAEAA